MDGTEREYLPSKTSSELNVLMSHIATCLRSVAKMESINLMTILRIQYN